VHHALVRRHLVAAAAAAILAGSGTQVARADADPASDVLAFDRVFLVVDSKSAPPYLRELTKLTAETEKRHLPIRIAIIEQQTDLGGLLTFYGRAGPYARFLRSELQYVFHGTVLVVMTGKPGGVALSGPAATQRAKTVVARLNVPTAGTPAELARVASTAIRQVAETHGIHLTTPRATADAPSTTNWLLYALVGVAVVSTGALAFLLLRRR
jgi:hypothetical protein